MAAKFVFMNVPIRGWQLLENKQMRDLKKKMGWQRLNEENV